MDTKIFEGNVDEFNRVNDRLSITINGKKFSCFKEKADMAEEVLKEAKSVKVSYYNTTKDDITYNNIISIKGIEEPYLQIEVIEADNKEDFKSKVNAFNLNNSVAFTQSHVVGSENIKFFAVIYYKEKEE